MLAALLLSLWLGVQVNDAKAIDCFSFAYQEQAQTVLDGLASDPYWLDRDGNGIACDDIRGAVDRFAEFDSEERDGPGDDGGGPDTSVFQEYEVVERVSIDHDVLIHWDDNREGTTRRAIDSFLIGLDLPRSQNWSQLREGFTGPECHAEQSLSALEGLLPEGTRFYIERPDEGLISLVGKGAYIWIDSQEEGEYILINEQLIREGIAVAADSNTGQLTPTKYGERFAVAQTEAIENRAGLWGSC